MLGATSNLITQLKTIADNFLVTTHPGLNGISEQNFNAKPEEIRQKAIQDFSNDMGNALDTWLQNVIFLVNVGTLSTAGSPTNHVNTSTGFISKK